MVCGLSPTLPLPVQHLVEPRTFNAQWINTSLWKKVLKISAKRANLKPFLTMQDSEASLNMLSLLNVQRRAARAWIEATGGRLRGRLETLFVKIMDVGSEHLEFWLNGVVLFTVSILGLTGWSSFLKKLNLFLTMFLSQEDQETFENFECPASLE